VGHRVAIIGGGYAGLACAVELADAGVPVTVFEAAKQLGGRARRVDHRGLALDNGCHILLGAYRETLRLVERVAPGASDRLLLRVPLQLEIHGRFSLRAPRLLAPLHTLAAIVGARGIGSREKLAATRFMLAQRRAGFRLARDETVDALLTRHGQTGAAAEYLWRPLCVAALNTPSADASAQVFLNVLRDGLNADRRASDLLLPRCDLSILFPERAAACIEAREGRIRTGCGIETITATGDAIALNAQGERFEFSHVVCAVQPARAAALLERLEGFADTVARLRQFTYQPIYSVYLQYPCSVVLPHVMTGMSGGLGHWAFDRERLCGQRGLLAVVISGSGPHEAFAHHDLANRLHQELSAVLPRLPEPVWHRVIAEKRATFSCIPGLRRPAQRTPLDGLLLAGDYTDAEYPATIEAAVKSGVQCARLVLKES
jgi:hydroxysqualene dehydroxylase